MKILVLEDEQVRIDGPLGIRTLCPSCEVTWVTTPWAFRDVYAAGTFDLVVLDRDLQLPPQGGGYTTHEPSGEDVLGLIRPDQTVLVWSWNSVAPAMARQLRRQSELAETDSLIVQMRFGSPALTGWLKELEKAARAEVGKE